MTVKQFCTACGKTPLRWDNVSGKCRRCIKAKPPSDTLDVKGDTATLTKLTTETVRTLADLVRVCQIDTTEWTIERWTCAAYQQGAKDAEGQLNAQELFSIKAWLRRNVVIRGVKAEIASLLEDAKASLDVLQREQNLLHRDTDGTLHVGGSGLDPLRQPTGAVHPRNVHLLEIAIPDLHLGKLAWKPETGYSDYDVKIAEKLFDTALEALIDRTKHFSFDKIVFPVGNDLLHSDTKQGQTTKGTPLDTDSRYYKAFGIGRRMVSRAIDKLRLIAPVTVVCVAGNHDQLSTYHLSDSLSCLYGADSGVTIMGDPILRKYFSYGKVALMYTHGDKGKSSDWPLLFATEQPKMFGSSLFREIHIGHYHQTRTTEYHGVRVRISPALCPADAWHSDNQFVGNLRGAEALVWHPDDGLVAQAFYTVKE